MQECATYTGILKLPSSCENVICSSGNRSISLSLTKHKHLLSFVASKPLAYVALQVLLKTLSFPPLLLGWLLIFSMTATDGNEGLR